MLSQLQFILVILLNSYLEDCEGVNAREGPPAIVKQQKIAFLHGPMTAAALCAPSIVMPLVEMEGANT